MVISCVVCSTPLQGNWMCEYNGSRAYLGIQNAWYVNMEKGVVGASCQHCFLNAVRTSNKVVNETLTANSVKVINSRLLQTVADLNVSTGSSGVPQTTHSPNYRALWETFLKIAPLVEEIRIHQDRALVLRERQSWAKQQYHQKQESFKIIDELKCSLVDERHRIVALQFEALKLRSCDAQLKQSNEAMEGNVRIMKDAITFLTGQNEALINQLEQLNQLKDGPFSKAIDDFQQFQVALQRIPLCLRCTDIQQRHKLKKVELTRNIERLPSAAIVGFRREVKQALRHLHGRLREEIQILQGLMQANTKWMRESVLYSDEDIDGSLGITADKISAKRYELMNCERQCKEWDVIDFMSDCEPSDPK